MDFRWSIENVRRNDSDGGVITVYWKCRAVGLTDKRGNELFKAGQLEVTPDPSSDDFIPFDQLTEPTVFAWVMSAIGTEVMEKMTEEWSHLEIQDTAIGTPWA